MSSIVERLERAFDGLRRQGLAPVTAVVAEPDHRALADLGGDEVRAGPGGELRFRGVPVYRVRGAEGPSLVGRSLDGGTRRLPFPADQPK